MTLDSVLEEEHATLWDMHHRAKRLGSYCKAGILSALIMGGGELALQKTDVFAPREPSTYPTYESAQSNLNDMQRAYDSISQRMPPLAPTLTSTLQEYKTRRDDIAKDPEIEQYLRNKVTYDLTMGIATIATFITGLACVIGAAYHGSIGKRILPELKVLELRGKEFGK